MSVFSYILLALAVSLSAMVSVKNSAVAFPIRLTRGLGVAFLMAAMQCVMLSLGMFVANSMPQFEFQDYNNLIFIGLSVLVAVRYLYNVFSKNRREAAFDISNWGVVAALSLAVGMNVMLLGLALGFKASLGSDCLKALVPMFITMMLFVYCGIMLGRQKAEIKTRRWLFFATIFLLVFILKSSLE